MLINNFLLRLFRRANGFGSNQVLVVAIHYITDAIGVQAEDVKAPLEFVVNNIFHDVVNGVVDVLDHAGQNKSRLHHILIRINADYEMGGASVRVFAGLLDGIKSTQA